MKITLVSDTHMRHEELGILKGDVLIHCGDMFDLFQRDPGDLARVDEWFSRQRFDLILCIGGNHDHPLTGHKTGMTRGFQNAVYLEDEAFEYGGVKFYGSPWVPYLQTHAFFADDETRRQKWNDIPTDTDVLITHTPPFAMLDQSSQGHTLGCPHLSERLSDLNPRLHCFGHVHASGGKAKRHGTRFVNASSVRKMDGKLRRPIKVRI